MQYIGAPIDILDQPTRTLLFELEAKQDIESLVDILFTTQMVEALVTDVRLENGQMFREGYLNNAVRRVGTASVLTKGVLSMANFFDKSVKTASELSQARNDLLKRRHEMRALADVIIEQLVRVFGYAVTADQWREPHSTWDINEKGEREMRWRRITPSGTPKGEINVRTSHLTIEEMALGADKFKKRLAPELNGLGEPITITLAVSSAILWIVGIVIISLIGAWIAWLFSGPGGEEEYEDWLKRQIQQETDPKRKKELEDEYGEWMRWKSEAHAEKGGGMTTALWIVGGLAFLGLFAPSIIYSFRRRPVY
jgi:hypothetical protein